MERVLCIFQWLDATAALPLSMKPSRSMFQVNANHCARGKVHLLTYRGHPPVYLRNTDPTKPKAGSVRFLGVQWK